MQTLKEDREEFVNRMLLNIDTRLLKLERLIN
jgi:hypothetical protein